MSGLTLPSGSTISADTWAAVKADGTWHGWFPPGMYCAEDRAFMDAALA